MTKIKITNRANSITPFHVMDILAKAKKLEQQGRDIIHMEVGEPDFATPQAIIDAGVAALNQGKTHYTPALGLPELRVAIAQWYHDRYAVDVSPNRIIVTPGASGALLLVMGALAEQNSNVLLADPGYPCNCNFARFVEANTTQVCVGSDTQYQLTAADIERYWDSNSSVALVASPSNPTGTLLSQSQIKDLSAAIKKRQGHLVVDEIYHGLTYDDIQAQTALAVDQDAFVINSFSKYFGMTGWRLGWLVVPESYVDVMDRLAQNLYLAAPTVSQYAALAAFQADTIEELERRRHIFEQRRNILLPALRNVGFDIPVTPQGAFYLYANCSELLTENYPNSMALCDYLLSEAGVAITPGLDFGHNSPEQHCRFAYTTDSERLLEAVDRIAKALNR